MRGEASHWKPLRRPALLRLAPVMLSLFLVFGAQPEIDISNGSGGTVFIRKSAAWTAFVKDRIFVAIRTCPTGNRVASVCAVLSAAGVDSIGYALDVCSLRATSPERTAC